MISPSLVRTVAALGGALCLVASGSLGSEANAQITPDYVLSVADTIADAGTQAQIDVDLDATQGTGLDGWSFGLCHDGQILTLVSVTGLGDLAMPPVTPIFESQVIEDDGPGGATDGFNTTVIVDFGLMTVFAPASSVAVNTATYDVIGAEAESTALSFCDGLGAFPVGITVIENQVSLVPTTDDGSFTVAFAFTPFVRGDCNTDPGLQLADGITILNALAGTVPPCLEACDVNGDGNLGVVDAISLFSYLFLSGAPPAAPFPDCGMPAAPNPDCTFDAGQCP